MPLPDPSTGPETDRSAEDIGESATGEHWHTLQRLAAAEAELHANAEQVAFQHRLARELRQIADPAEIMDKVVSTLGPALDVSRCLVYLADTDGVAPSLAQWMAPGLDMVSTQSRTSPEMAEMGAEYARRHESLWIEDVHDDPRIEPDIAIDIVDRLGCQAHGAVSLEMGGRLLGWLVLQSTRPRRWAVRERALLEGVAADLSGALTQALARVQAEETVRTLRELGAAKVELVATISHELRTPLASISGYLEVCADGDLGELNPEQQNAIEVMLRNCERLQRLVDNLLTLSHIDDGELLAKQAPIDLVAIVEDAHRSLEPALAAGDIAFSFTSERGLGDLVGNGNEIQSVVLNLLSNAVKFTPEGGSVDVHLERDGEHLRLAVRDTGLGIAHADQTHVFRRFFRTTEAGQHAIPGSGLGLAVVKSIVEQHGGSIDLESELGAGTTFTVNLPVASPGEGSDS